eukprot:10798308-Alexandrium_andersonii.AAC.1
MSETPPGAGGAARSAASSALGSAVGGVSDFRRFGAAQRAVWPVGHAGIAAPSGWMLGHERNLTRHKSDRPMKYSKVRSEEAAKGAGRI